MVTFTLRVNDRPAQGKRSGGTLSSAAGMVTQETIAVKEHLLNGEKPLGRNVEPLRGMETSRGVKLSRDMASSDAAAVGPSSDAAGVGPSSNAAAMGLSWCGQA